LLFGFYFLGKQMAHSIRAPRRVNPFSEVF
jgi:hypothetical protein